MNRLVCLYLLAQCLLCATFPLTIEIFSAYNSPGSNSFNVSSSLQLPSYTDPIIFAGISQYRATAKQEGAVVLTYAPNNIGIMVNLNLQGSQWNQSVVVINVLVGVCSRQDQYYQSVFLNLTQTSSIVPIDSHYNSSNCNVAMFLLGWKDLPLSKSFSCNISSPGQLNCSFSFNTNSPGYLYYNILIVDKTWYASECVGCQTYYINPSNLYKPLQKNNSVLYRYMYGFQFISFD